MIGVDAAHHAQDDIDEKWQHRTIGWKGREGVMNILANLPAALVTRLRLHPMLLPKGTGAR